MRRLIWLSPLLLFLACSKPPPTTPSLTPNAAAELLRLNSKAEGWLKYIQKQNATCEYRVDLPDQTNHPTTIDMPHVVSCGGRQSPKELDATVSFEYDPAAHDWVISRFST